MANYYCEYCGKSFPSVQQLANGGVCPKHQMAHLKTGTLLHFKTPKEMNPKIDLILPVIGEYAVVSVLSDKKEKYGMINRSGDFVIEPLWDMISYAGGDLVALNVGFYRGDDCYDDDDGIWSLCSLSGRNVTQTKYNDIQLWGDSLQFTASDLVSKRYGIANIYGDVLVSFEYDYLSTPNFKEWIYATKDGKNGYINKGGDVMIPLICNELPPVFEISTTDFSSRKGCECYYIYQTNKKSFAMKHAYTTKRCNVIDAASDIFDGAQQHLMCYDFMDLYHIFGSTTTTYAQRYKFLNKINSPERLLKAIEEIGIDLAGRTLLVHITYPMGMDSGLITDSRGFLHSTFFTIVGEILIIPTLKKRIKFWQVKLYVFGK